MKKTIALILVICLFTIVPVSAYTTIDNDTRISNISTNIGLNKFDADMSIQDRKIIEERLKNIEYSNFDELSIDDKRTASEYLNKEEKIYYPFVHEDEAVVIYETEKDDLFVVTTGDHIEVISLENEKTMIINGEEVNFEVSISEFYDDSMPKEIDSLSDLNSAEYISSNLKNSSNIDSTNFSPSPMYSNSYMDISDPGGPWTYITTRRVDITFESAIITMTVGAIALKLVTASGLFALLPVSMTLASQIASGILSLIAGAVVADSLKTLRYDQQSFEHNTRFKTFAYNERAVGVDMQGNPAPSGDWYDRYIAWAPNW